MCSKRYTAPKGTKPAPPTFYECRCARCVTCWTSTAFGSSPLKCATSAAHLQPHLAAALTIPIHGGDQKIPTRHPNKPRAPESDEKRRVRSPSVRQATQFHGVNTKRASLLRFD